MNGGELGWICAKLGMACLVLAAVALRLRAQLVRFRRRLDRERYRQVLNTSHDAVVLVDCDNVIRFANDAVGSMLGHTPESPVGSPLSILQPERFHAGHTAGIAREESLADLMQRLLTRRGYRVTAFTDPQEALACFESADADFDFVLTDHNMPKMSGLDLARALLRLRPALPVAILSGYVNDGLRENAAEAGVREVFYKENLVQHLCDRIEEFVRGGAGR